MLHLRKRRQFVGIPNSAIAIVTSLKRVRHSTVHLSSVATTCHLPGWRSRNSLHRSMNVRIHIATPRPSPSTPSAIDGPAHTRVYAIACPASAVIHVASFVWCVPAACNVATLSANFHINPDSFTFGFIEIHPQSIHNSKKDSVHTYIHCVQSTRTGSNIAGVES